MNKWIKNLSPVAELIIVMFIGFGLFVYSSTYRFFVINSELEHIWTYQFTSRGEYTLIIYELIAMLMIGYLLKVRNWKLKDFNLDFTYSFIWIAFLLLFIRNMITAFCFSMFELMGLVNVKDIDHIQYSLSANWISIALIVVINSVYEEILLVGYLFKRLENYSPAVIIGASLFIRTSVHTYQGLVMLFSIVPLALVFGYYYYLYKKLWPLIIAHGIHNIMAFLSMHFGHIRE